MSNRLTSVPFGIVSSYVTGIMVSYDPGTGVVLRQVAPATFLGSLGTQSADGSAVAPSITFAADTNTGIYRIGADQIGLTMGGVLRAWFGTTYVVFGSPSGSGAAYTLYVQGESTTAISVQRSSADATGPAFSFNKSRGTLSAPAVVAINDSVGRLDWLAHTGAVFSTVGRIQVTCVEPVPGVGLLGSRMVLSVAPIGTAVVAEIARLGHETGFSMFGANPVIDQNRHIRLRSYTVATLPSASPSGQLIYCSDLGGGGGVLSADGATWRRVREGSDSAVATDAAFTLTVFSSASRIRHTGTLTANRAVTLSTTNAYAGAHFDITRTGGGAFMLDIGTGPLKSLATNTWCKVIYNGTAWYLAAYGTL